MGNSEQAQVGTGAGHRQPVRRWPDRHQRHRQRDLGRNQLGINTFENFIQTDAAINPGNAPAAPGGHRRNLLGINTAIYSRSGGNLGIGFAISRLDPRIVMEGLVRTAR